ncbi:MAG: CxxC-x17-CxxC domain-containing protein [Patescibacteria group bacterium]
MNLKCAECGTPITELPFKPAPDRDVYCFECNKKRRANFAR